MPLQSANGSTHRRKNALTGLISETAVDRDAEFHFIKVLEGSRYIF
jgi:RecJ-like exonuclease